MHREYIGEAAIVAFRPNVTAGDDIVELRRNPHPVAVAAHAALDHVADAEFLGDLLHVNGLAFVGERRVPRDHVEPAQLRQRGGDVLAHAVGEIFLFGVAAHVDEREHGDGGPVGQRQGWPQRLLGVVRRRSRGDSRFDAGCCRSHIADEPHPLSCDGADQLLILAAVADRLPCSVDAAAQSRVRHGSAAPDGCDEVVLADDPIAIARQIDEQVEHLRLDMHGNARAPELAPRQIDLVVTEAEDHSQAKGLPDEPPPPAHARTLPRPSSSSQRTRKAIVPTASQARLDDKTYSSESLFSTARASCRRSRPRRPK